jgi:hypothetical protein
MTLRYTSSLDSFRAARAEIAIAMSSANVLR